MDVGKSKVKASKNSMSGEEHFLVNGVFYVSSHSRKRRQLSVASVINLS
jgi:hypothetical protein